MHREKNNCIILIVHYIKDKKKDFHIIFCTMVMDNIPPENANCDNCKNSTNCSNSTNLTNCKNVHESNDCSNCTNSVRLSQSSNCHQSEDLFNCSNCINCKGLANQSGKRNVVGNDYPVQVRKATSFLNFFTHYSLLLFSIKTMAILFQASEVQLEVLHTIQIALSPEFIVNYKKSINI